MEVAGLIYAGLVWFSEIGIEFNTLISFHFRNQPALINKPAMNNFSDWLAATEWRINSIIKSNEIKIRFDLFIWLIDSPIQFIAAKSTSIKRSLKQFRIDLLPWISLINPANSTNELSLIDYRQSIQTKFSLNELRINY